MKKILIIEDDQILADGLNFTLKKAGYSVCHVKTAKEGMDVILKGNIDLILLDVLLPDGNGYHLCSSIRQVSKTPIIFLTGCDDAVNIVMGLEKGAEDYVTKPFHLEVLLARIDVQLRRTQINKDVFCVGDLLFYAEQSRVMCQEEDLMLTLTEMRLLRTLAEHHGQIMTRSRLLENIWDDKGSFIDENTLSVHVRHLREKLKKADSEVSIKTYRGIGYRLETGSLQP